MSALAPSRFFKAEQQMGILGEWQASRERRRRAERYLRDILDLPEAEDADWLVKVGVDRTVAVRELTYLRRALGLIVAERDALDDQTAADVSHALTAMLETEARHGHDAAAGWAARWRAYTAAMAMRGQVDAPATRLARVLLEGAGHAAPPGVLLEEATRFVQSARARSNEALRAVFGVASLPEDVAPSALRP